MQDKTSTAEHEEKTIMNKYTVIGIYEEPFGQRFAGSYEAASAQEAEAMAPEGLIVAGVVAGDIEMADLYTDGILYE